MKIFNEKQKEWIIKNAIGLRNEKLTEMFNKEFNANMTVGQIKKFKNYHHISSGLKSCNLPVGSERENKGYILIKIAEPNIWIEKHRYIYEKVNGNIPPRHKIIFADGNKRNFELSNLILVSDSEKLIMNCRNLHSKEAELTKTGALLAKLIDKINKSDERAKGYEHNNTKANI